MNINFWKELKEYYENEYTEHNISKSVRIMADEIIKSDAVFLGEPSYYQEGEVSIWVDELIDTITGNDPRLADIYPHWNMYDLYTDPIASIFLEGELDNLRIHLAKGDEEYLNMILELEWFKFYPEEARDIFFI